MTFERPRTQLTALLVALLVLLAGCSGLGGTSATPSDAEQSTETPDPATEESTDEPTEADDTTGEEARESELSGRMLVVVDGKEKHLDADSDAAFWFNESRKHTWHAEESMTLESALEDAGVDASEESVSFENATYNESDENTTISYRVAGTQFDDPSNYELEDMNPAHEIIISVDTDAEREVPGREVEQSHPHSHGQLNVTVEGEQIDMTQDKYTMADEYFHFHGDEGAKRWHAHSLNVTTSYAISTFPGMNLTSDSFTYEDTTYGEETPGTSLNVTVDGEPVDPESYVLKDGDTLEVSVNQTNP